MERLPQSSEQRRARPVLSFNSKDETGRISDIIAKAQDLLEGEDRQRFMQMINGLKGDGSAIKIYVYDDVLALINDHVALEDISGMYDEYAPLDEQRAVDGTVE